MNPNPNPSVWFMTEGDENDNLAVDAWTAVLDDPTVINLMNRPYSATVRLAYESVQGFAIMGTAGTQTPRLLVILGVYGHPDPTVPDLLIKKGDRFVSDADRNEYEVFDIIKQLGTVQARAQRRT